MNAQEREYIRLGRHKARTDALWLARNVLGMKKMAEHVHRPMANFLQQFGPYQGVDEWNEQEGRFIYTPSAPDPIDAIPTAIEGEKRLLLAPRSWYKTSLNVVTHSVQWILNYPDITILWLHASQEVLEPVITVVKRAFWKNNVMRYYFPEYCVPAGQREFGTQVSFNIPNRKVYSASPTLGIGGIESVRTGMHYHVIKYTDIVDDKNSTTKDLCEKIVQKFGMCRNLLISPKYWSDVEGTRYNFSDLYGRVIDDWLKEDKLGLPHQYKCFIMGCYKKDVDNERFSPDELDAPYLLDPAKQKDEKTGKDLRRISRFPEAEPTEVLESKRIDSTYGEEQFNTQQLNNPVGTDNMIFPPEQMRWKSEADLKHIPMQYYVTTIDLANTTNKKSNYTAITTCGVDRMNRRYVVDIQLGKYPADEIVDRIFATQLLFKPIRVKIEKTAFLDGLRPSITRKSQMTGIWPNFEYLPRDSEVTKQMRIELSLQPWYKQGLIFFNEGLDTFVKEHLKHELTRFPKYSYDDVLDTLADQFQGETVFGPLKMSRTEEQVLKDAKRLMIQRAEDFQAIFGKQDLDQGSWTGLGAL